MIADEFTNDDNTFPVSPYIVKLTAVLPTALSPASIRQVAT
jgi:hypothetical protein